MRKMTKSLGLIVVCLTVFAQSSLAIWVQDGALVGKYYSIDMYYPQLASDGSGGAIIVWWNSLRADISAQRLDVAGDICWEESGVAICSGTADGASPVITSDGAGGAVVVWVDERNGNQDIYAQRLDNSGTGMWDAGGVPICTATGSQTQPVLVSDGAGGAIIAWRDSRSYVNVYIQRIDHSGTVMWTSDGINLCPVSANQAEAVLVSDMAGGAISSWVDYRNGNGDIYAQRITASGAILWPAAGVPLCTNASSQLYISCSADGDGGSIVAWTDQRNSNYDIYTQRIDSSGVVQWSPDGVAVCTAALTQYYPKVVPDGTGGAIITWYDFIGGFNDVYAQRVNASGTAVWAADGVGVCTVSGNQLYPELVPDGDSGAIITWQDERSGSFDIYAQRVDSSGVAAWPEGGIAVCKAVDDQKIPAIIPDDRIGAIIAWADNRRGNYDIYVQQIDIYGRMGYFYPDILSIDDVPDDQGGVVRISIEQSPLDSAVDSPASTYNVWQRLDGLSSLSLAAIDVPGAASSMESVSPALKSGAEVLEDWPLKSVDGRILLMSRDLPDAWLFPEGTWELVGSFAACQQDQYVYRTSTLADSSEAGIPYSVYMVSVHTVDPLVWSKSDPDSGYSVDNIAPGVPLGLSVAYNTGSGNELIWAESHETDFQYFRVYRDVEEAFMPGPDNLVYETALSHWTDPDHDGSDVYYMVSALDHAGNESLPVSPDVITGSEDPILPDAFMLEQNIPNPFNPSTTIFYDVPEGGGVVSIRIFDVAGRLVRILVDEHQTAGSKTVTWNGVNDHGQSVTSGLFFYRMTAPGFTRTRKMVLLR